MADPLVRLQAALAGRYTIERELGRGGMALVFLARDLKHDRRVALKVLRPELAAALGAERFLREIEIAAQLTHPHILALYDSGQAEGVLYYVMPFVEGESLRVRLDREKQLALDDALQVVREVADALSYAHGHNVVHRDVKPENILLEAGHAVVSDFGIARAISAAGGAKLTETGIAVGTPLYMSPEQATAEGLIDGRSDIYALGCVLYEMLAGAPPFTGPSAQAVLARHTLDPVPPLRTVRKAVPAAVEQAVMKALEKVPADRFRSAAQFAAALQSSAVQRAITASRGRVTSRRPTQARIRSLAVLPLENLSRNPDEEYFADGMTDALITTLAQLGALRVISRTSVMRYKGVRRSLPEIARELKVDAVIEGTVVRSGGRVRIAAQLIHAATDTHLWSKQYETELRDVLALQSEVARTIAQEIQIQVSRQEEARLAGTHRVDPAAYEVFLRGRHHWYRRSPDGLNKALQYLQEAVARDPEYAPAFAGLADAYITLGWDLFGMVAPADSYPKAKAAATKALDLDPHCAEAHAALGWAAASFDWDWSTAETRFRRALELKPQYGPAHIWYSHFLTAMGRTAEASDESTRALECDPLGLVLNMHMGWHQLYSREYRPAIQQLLRTLELDPGFVLAQMFLGEAYEQVGMFDEAVAAFERAVTVSQREPVYLAGLGHAYAVSGGREEAFRTIRELEELSTRRYVSARAVAEIYIGLADNDRAFTWLDKAFEQRNGWLLHLRENPRYDPLRADQRYVRLVRRMNLP